MASVSSTNSGRSMVRSSQSSIDVHPIQRVAVSDPRAACTMIQANQLAKLLPPKNRTRLPFASGKSFAAHLSHIPQLNSEMRSHLAESQSFETVQGGVNALACSELLQAKDGQVIRSEEFRLDGTSVRSSQRVQWRSEGLHTFKLETSGRITEHEVNLNIPVSKTELVVFKHEIVSNSTSRVSYGDSLTVAEPLIARPHGANFIFTHEPYCVVLLITPGVANHHDSVRPYLLQAGSRVATCAGDTKWEDDVAYVFKWDGVPKVVIERTAAGAIAFYLDAAS